MNTIGGHKVESSGNSSLQLVARTYHDVADDFGAVLAPLKLALRELRLRLDADAGAWIRQRYNALLDAVLDDDDTVCDLCGCHVEHPSHRQTGSGS